MTKPLIVHGHPVAYDAEGLYRLDDIYLALPPSRRTGRTPDDWATGYGLPVIDCLREQAGLSVIRTTPQGTYAARPLAIAYAMWAIPEFFETVMNTYLAEVGISN